MPSAAVVVPFRGGEPHRERNCAWIVDRYTTLHPWPVFVADNEGRWSKGAAVASAVEMTNADVLVIADADSFTTPEAITEAVELVANGTPWVIPHGTVYRLSEQATQTVLTGGQPSRRNVVRAPYEGPAGGGITAISRDAYEAVGGIDPRFYDWGGEDICWAMALQTLVAEPHRIGADLFHLWHPHPSPNYDKPPESEALLAAYIAAKYHPGQMRAVLAGKPYAAPAPLSQPRTFHSARPVRTLHIGTERATFRDHLFSTTDPDIAEAVERFPNVTEVFR